MSREELTEIERTLPGVFVRWGITRDLPGIIAIERATLGWWDERDFREELRKRNVVIYVACTDPADSSTIRGFCVYETWDEPGGPRRMRVFNMAASDPVARRALIEKAREKAREWARDLYWLNEAENVWVEDPEGRAA